MKTLWKTLLALALLVPMAAYVAGSLVASAADDPTPRPPIVIKDAERPASPTSDPTPTEEPYADPGPSGVGRVELDPDDIDDDSDDWGRGDDEDHGEDHGDDHPDDPGGDDHSGPGGDDGDGGGDD